MKNTYLVFSLCLFLSFCNAQDDSTKIVKDFIENFNNRDSTATLNNLHKNFVENWYRLAINTDKREFSKSYSWANVMNEYEEIEIVSSSSKHVVVNSVYYSDLDALLGNMPYKCVKKYTVSKGKIINILTTKNKGYEVYQSKRKQAYIKFKNWLRTNYELKREDFKINREDALRLNKIVLEFLSQDVIVER